MEQNINNTAEAVIETKRKWLPICLASFGAVFAIFCAVFAIMYADFGRTFVLVMHHPFLGGAGWIAGICAVLAIGVALVAYLLSNSKLVSLICGIALIALAIPTIVMAAFMWWGIFLVFAGLLYLAGGLYLLNIQNIIMKLKKR